MEECRQETSLVSTGAGIALSEETASAASCATADLLIPGRVGNTKKRK